MLWGKPGSPATGRIPSATMGSGMAERRGGCARSRVTLISSPCRLVPFFSSAFTADSLRRPRRPAAAAGAAVEGRS